jgi:hypothetical protein
VGELGWEEEMEVEKWLPAEGQLKEVSCQVCEVSQGVSCQVCEVSREVCQGESAQVEELGWEEETEVKKWLPAEGQLEEVSCQVCEVSQGVSCQVCESAQEEVCKCTQEEVCDAA